MIYLAFMLGFPGGAVVKNPPANAGDPRNKGLIPGLGRSPEGGHSNPLQYSGLENSMDHIVHGVAKSQTQLSDLHFHFHGNKFFLFSLKIPVADSF